ncbi:MAG: hypothetical protein ABIQ81_04395 [Novosphingobium sp.]
MRIPAREIERVVGQEVTELFADALLLAQRASIHLPPNRFSAVAERCEDLASELGRGGPKLRPLIARVQLLDDGLRIEVSSTGIAELLELPFAGEGDATISITSSVRLTRTGRAMRLVQGDGGLAVQRGPDPSLVKLLVRAQQWWRVLGRGETDIKTLAQAEQVSAPYITRVVRLAFLSPEVVEAALNGQLTASIDGAALLATGAIPARWDEQASKFMRTFSGNSLES